MLRVEMLPAGNGDCLWIEYGTAHDVRRLLIDAGRRADYPCLRARILALPPGQRVFELLVITHIDNDHIEGSLPLLQDTTLGCEFKEVWYNGRRHLDAPKSPAPSDTLGPKEGEFLGVLLDDLALPWNAAFGEGAVVTPEGGELPTVTLDGGLELTVLSPTSERLTALKRDWDNVLADANFPSGNAAAIRAELQRRRYLGTPADALGRVEEGPPGRDNSAANGSSIALLAHYGGKRALLTGDAFASVLQASLTRLGATPQQPYKVDLWKLAHHGSWANFTPDLLALVSAPKYLVSTNGAVHLHPHARTLNFLIEHQSGRRKPELVFNYRCATTEAWAANHPLADRFTASYPAGAVLVL